MDMHTLATGFSSARMLNHAQTPLLPLIVLLCVQAPRESVFRKVWFAVAAFWWALLFVCESRASVLAIAVGCIAALTLRQGYARQVLTMMVWTALLGLVIYALFFLLLPIMVGLQPIGAPMSVLERTAANPSSNRNLLWGRAVQLIGAHPLLGVGPQHFAHFGSDLKTGAHPHDWLLQIAVEWGCPALLCLLGVVFMGLRALIRAGKRIRVDDIANQQFLVALFIACIAIFIDGLFSGVLVMPQSQLVIAIVLGMACAWVRTQEAPAQEISIQSPLSRLSMGTLVVVGFCSLLWSVAPNLIAHARGDKLSPAEALHNSETYWPRMWLAGYF